ncbi:hypothetical protein WICMUC_003268 [Wickerhamomyces mucosus]|uniref:HMG box domain-containing protein n=1 Tax=Wickerhamomyces mucosus TaxID=1378264 RepID=A0A9P8TCT7_9ASCO|nr:hypothetical protein WICMUC_003268 [Wickerhamomyces mucosus]
MLSLFKSQTSIFARATYFSKPAVSYFSTTANLFKNSGVSDKAAKKSNKSKKSKSPVKRASSAYLYYVKDFFNNNKTELASYPSFKEKAIYVSDQWKALSDYEKEPFEKLAEADKKRFDSEKSKYLSSRPPKRPLTAFLRYSQEVRPSITSQNPGVSVLEIAKIIGNQWKTLSGSEQQKYKDEYTNDIAEWKKQNSHA